MPLWITPSGFHARRPRRSTARVARSRCRDRQKGLQTWFVGASAQGKTVSRPRSAVTGSPTCSGWRPTSRAFLRLSGEVQASRPAAHQNARSRPPLAAQPHTWGYEFTGSRSRYRAHEVRHGGRRAPRPHGKARPARLPEPPRRRLASDTNGPPQAQLSLPDPAQILPSFPWHPITRMNRCHATSSSALLRKKARFRLKTMTGSRPHRGMRKPFMKPKRPSGRDEPSSSIGRTPRTDCAALRRDTREAPASIHGRPIFRGLP